MNNDDGELMRLREQVQALKRELTDVATQARNVTQQDLATTAVLADVIERVNALTRVTAMLARVQ